MSGDRYGPQMPGDRYGPQMPPRMPGMDRYPPPPGDNYYPMPPDRYPMMPGDRYPMMPGDRYPMPPAAGDRYPMPGGDRYPPGADRYPMPPGADRYPMPPGADRYPMPPGADRYPMPPAGDRYYPRPGGAGDGVDSKYPPTPNVNNRYPDDDRYGNKDRYNPDAPNTPGMYPDNRNPPSRGQPIDRPPYGAEPPYSVRYPDGPDMRYGMMGPYPSRYPVSDNRFPVGSDRFPTNIYKYGNRGRVPPYSPMGYLPVDMGDRGYGQRGQRPPYIMVGFGQPDMDNSISDTYGMPYGPPGIGGSRPSIMAGTRCDEVDSYKQMGLRQKMRKQFVRRAVRVPSLTHCQRECTSARDFICRSFNYRDDGTDRPTSTGTGDTFNCELSDRDTRELDVNNPQMFESGNADFYERSIGGRSNDAECLDVSQVCNEDGMEFTLRTNEPFAGRIYSYGFYDR